MKFLLSCLACALILTPGLARASTYHEKYVEYVYYHFTYYFPYRSVAVEEFWNPDTEQWYKRASRGDDPGGYRCLNPETGERDWDCEGDAIEFGFFLEGSEIVPLDNLTFDMKAFPATIGGYAATSYGTLDYITYGDDCYSSSYGSISFGPTGEIASYDMGYFSCDSTGVFASSGSTLLSELFAYDMDNIEDAHLLEGIFGYDSTYLVPGDYYFSQRPGYWTTSITRECRLEIYEDGQVYDFHSVPCPAAAPPPPAFASAPLPAAGWLLLGALGLLGAGAARGRRG